MSLQQQLEKYLRERFNEAHPEATKGIAYEVKFPYAIKERCLNGLLIGWKKTTAYRTEVRYRPDPDAHMKWVDFKDGYSDEKVVALKQAIAEAAWNHPQAVFERKWEGWRGMLSEFWYTCGDTRADRTKRMKELFLKCEPLLEQRLVADLWETQAGGRFWYRDQYGESQLVSQKMAATFLENVPEQNKNNNIEDNEDNNLGNVFAQFRRQ